VEKEERLHGEEAGATAADAETGKKPYQKAGLTVHGDLKEVTGGDHSG
jgi:hypothetical protein